MAEKRAHSDQEATYSMVDILAEQDDLEESVLAVLGGSDDKNCTYLQGYIKRQALYSCKTCAINSKEGHAGVCLACSLTCHENHEFVELYTKRNFRCDCGNKKFPEGFKCQLEPIKMNSNPDNKYNKNFTGLYCTCDRPYPDLEDEIEDEMIQCCVCEDWYHTRHLGSKPPAEFSEMVCDGCIHKHLFIYTYATDLPEEVDVTNNCFLKSVKKKKEVTEDAKACYFKSQWRLKLCKCAKCLKMYDKQKISFLIDEDDSVEAYEKKGTEGKKSQYEKGMEELSKLDRVQQVEVMSEYHDMKSELREYLGKFAATGQVVTKEHITQFFEDMKNKKRRRVAIPFNCR